MTDNRKMTFKQYIEEKPKFSKVTWMAIIAAMMTFSGFYGFIYELIFYYLNSGMKHWYWRGSCFFPWVNIYGIGSVVIFLLAYRLRKHPGLVFLVSGISCGLLELLSGTAIYLLFDGKRAWDYNTEIWSFGNIGGFVCLRSVLVFAFSGLFLIYVVLPIIFSFARGKKRKLFCCLSFCIFGVLMADQIYNRFLWTVIPGLINAEGLYSRFGLLFM